VILWRHLDDQKEFWVYHATRADAERELERLSIVNCATVHSRRFYTHHRQLERVDIVLPSSKIRLAKMMNKIERKEDVQWVM
jgi:hypothetical protein